MALIKVENLRYSYDGRNPVLENVDLEIRRGEVLALLGPNGAGKTTLLRCLLRALRPRGAIYIDGKRIEDYRTRELAKLLSYVPQTSSPPFNYRVLDFVLMGRAPHHGPLSTPSRREVEHALEVLRILGIEDLADRGIYEVSGGQFQLVLIARCLVQGAKILLLDEPTAHLDVSNRVKVLNLVKRLVEEGRIECAVMALHDPVAAALYSHRVALMHRGRIVAVGEPREVLREDLLEYVYGAKFVVIEVQGIPVPIALSPR